MGNVLFHANNALRIILSAGPRYSAFFLNTNCNRACDYCSVPKEGSNIELSTREWKNITDRVTSWGVRLISILGGESTLREDLPEIVEHISKNAAVNLTSNGDIFRNGTGKKLLRLMASKGLAVLSLSLHDIGDLHRQLDTLCYAKKIGIIAILGMVATKKSIDHIPDVMRATTQRQVFFRFSLYQNRGGLLSSNVNGLCPTAKQIEICSNDILKHKQETGFIQNTDAYLLEGADLYPTGWHCNSEKDHWVTVNNEGNLMTCCEFSTSIPVLSIDSLNDPRWAEIRKTKRNTCAGCTYQCYMDEEKSTRAKLIGMSVKMGLKLFQTSH